MTSYPYDTLPHGDVFRYLILQPGIGNDPLVCNLRIAAIADTGYDAVSYVWGTSVRDQHIECDGHDLLITANLSKVLRRVRLSNGPLTLWADSICINQENDKDKGHQVGLMGKIYRSAKRVLIYVGSDDEGHGPAVCSLLEEVDQTIQETCKKIDKSWDSFPHPNEDDPLLDDPRWDSLYVFISQSWFDRGWVVQEAALAAQGEVLWGKSTFDWEKLMRVYIWLSTRGGRVFQEKEFGEVQINAHTDVYLETHKEFAQVFYNDTSWGTPSILRTLNCAKELDLSNPRDRIYAFMDLPQVVGHQVYIRPDYSAPELQTYQRFASEYIRASKSTELLDFVSHDHESLISGIPSWVPRWDIPTWSLSQASAASSELQARDLSIPEPFLTDNEHLKVQGVIVDTILYASDLFDWDTTTHETFTQIWDTVNAAKIESPYPKSYTLEALLEALSAGTYRGEWSQWRHARDRFALEAGLCEDHKDDDNQPEMTIAGAEDEINIYFDLIRSRTHNRRFILTRRGYMGLAPLPACEGDLCAIIFGSQKPCILREKSDALAHLFLGATTLMAKDCYDMPGGGVSYVNMLGEEDGKDWLTWDVEEGDILLC
jgi:hypothetical protein